MSWKLATLGNGNPNRETANFRHENEATILWFFLFRSGQGKHMKSNYILYEGGWMGVKK